MINDYFKLASKNLKHRGARSWLTLLGIFIGVVSVVALIGLGNGLKLAVSAQFGVSTTEVITVQAGGIEYGPPGSGAVEPMTLDDMETIEGVDNVDFVFRRNIELVKVEYNEEVSFDRIINMPDGEKRDYAEKVLEMEALRGRLLKDGDQGKVFVGYNFYADKTLYDKQLDVGNKILIQDEKFEVVGVAEKKGSLIWDNLIFMNEEPLEELTGSGDTVDVIVVKLKDKELIEKTKLDIEKALRKSRGVEEGEENFEVSTPEAALATVNSVLVGIQIFIVIIALISVFVGAIGIVNTMTTAVVERKKEIGIMKAVGARNEQIFFQFLVEAGLLGLIGGLAGAIVGTGLSVLGTVGINQFLGTELAPNIDFFLMGLTLLGSFLIGAISGVAPAMRAAKQPPVEALRG